MKIKFELIKLPRITVEEAIEMCQKENHIQQVAYSTYHSCLTQICFTCGKVRTSLKSAEKDGK